MAHTPGPWLATQENRGAIPLHFQPFVVTDSTGASVICRLPDGWADQDRANHRLISAAPSMLEALEEITNHAYDDDSPIEDILADFDRMRNIASEAIAKAVQP